MELPQKTIVLAGVEFMGESAKLLNPYKTVLLPEPAADCPMAHMVDKKTIDDARARYGDDLAVVCYVNSTAEMKTWSDVCVTSSNAEKICRELPQNHLLFIPDVNLGRFVAKQVPEKHVILNNGFCPRHQRITPDEIIALEEEYPEALVLAHPECTEEVLAEADYLVEMGPVAGAGGGNVIAAGTVDEVEQSQSSRIAPFLRAEPKRLRPQVTDDEMFDQGHIRMATDAIHTVKPLEVDIPRGRLVAVTGVSGSGKTTLVLETLIPALKAQAAGERLPGHVRWVDAEGIARANLIDATPIGANVRSTVATYADIHDELRRAFARTPEAKAAGYKAGAFSYNTGALRCPTCDGTGSISLDVQFLPDVEIVCPACRGSRYADAASHIHREGKDGSLLTLPQLMDMSVDEAIDATVGLKKVQTRLQTLHDLGLGYLTLGEPTPALSGGEAQRLKLASEMGRVQDDAVFVFDEPTIGLHPLDVQVLLSVFDGLVAKGATVIVIEHDLDLIRNADYVIDMGPGGGDAGGQIVCAGTPGDIAACSKSITGRYL